MHPTQSALHAQLGPLRRLPPEHPMAACAGLIGNAQPSRPCAEAPKGASRTCPAGMLVGAPSKLHSTKAHNF